MKPNMIIDMAFITFLGEGKPPPFFVPPGNIFRMHLSIFFDFSKMNEEKPCRFSVNKQYCASLIIIEDIKKRFYIGITIYNNLVPERHRKVVFLPEFPLLGTQDDKPFFKHP